MMRQEPLQSSTSDPRRPPQRGAIVNIASQLGIVGRTKSSKSSNSLSCVAGRGLSSSSHEPIIAS